MFGRIKTVLENSSKIEYSDQMQKLFSDREVTHKIVELNTISQLFDKGEDATGQRLDAIGGEYKPSTVKKKQRQGLPTDRVTLSDTFTFYDSFTILAKADSFAIKYDPIKEGVDLRERWGQNISGLSGESIDELQLFSLPILQKNILSSILS